MSDGAERGRDRQIEGCSLLLDWEGWWLQWAVVRVEVQVEEHAGTERGPRPEWSLVVSWVSSLQSMHAGLCLGGRWAVGFSLSCERAEKWRIAGEAHRAGAAYHSCVLA